MRVVIECQTKAAVDAETKVIEIVVNGETCTAPAGLNLRELLVELGIDPSRVAAEVNRSIVRQADWDSTRIEAGASLEVVQFVGGG